MTNLDSDALLQSRRAHVRHICCDECALYSTVEYVKVCLYGSSLLALAHHYISGNVRERINGFRFTPIHLLLSSKRAFSRLLYTVSLDSGFGFSCNLLLNFFSKWKILTSGSKGNAFKAVSPSFLSFFWSQFNSRSMWTICTLGKIWGFVGS